MLKLVQKVLGLFRPYWKALGLIGFLIMLQKVGDLMVPFFAGQIIDAIAQNRAYEMVVGLVLTAFCFWLLHGNLLPYVLGRVDLAYFQYAGPRGLAVSVLRRLFASTPGNSGRDTALRQAVIERGEVVLVQFVNSIFRTAIPLALPGLVTLVLLLWWYPLIGLIAVVGGALDVLATVYLNKVLKPLYTRLQALDYERQRVHTHIFRNLLRIIVEGKEQGSVQEYDARFGDFASFGVHTGRRFLNFNLGRGLIINVTNVCTWLVGAWYVDGGVYTLGYFLASLSWSTYVLNVVGAFIELQKQWMETTPAIRAFFVELDGPGPVNDDTPEEAAAPAPAPVLVPVAAAVGAD